jgi:hypothetical protein
VANANAAETKPQLTMMRNPASRANLIEDQVARHLKEEITPGEGPGAQPIHKWLNRDLCSSLATRTDIHAVEVADEIENKQNGSNRR